MWILWEAVTVLNDRSEVNVRMVVVRWKDRALEGRICSWKDEVAGLCLSERPTH